MFNLNCKGRLCVVDKPVLMGIVNVTPDSFYEESRLTGMAQILNRIETMIREGAMMVDIGGQSTRPGSSRVGIEEELKRVVPIIEAIHNKFPSLLVSIDTYQAKVAREAVQAGASIINDISGGQADEKMMEVAASERVPYICMHMPSLPESMHVATEYKNVTLEVLDYFIEKKEECRRAGITDMIVDPGFGFGKNREQNFELLHSMNSLKILSRPILVGLSRKSTVYKTLSITPQEALNGTTVLHTLALLNGANILRVHDVKEAKEVVELVGHYHKSKEQAGADLFFY